MPTPVFEGRATVKFYSPEKGYGFIAGNGTPDAFFHRNAIRGYPPGRKPAQADEVNVRIIESDRGLRAVEVEFIP